MITLKTDRMTVLISEPGKRPNDTSRFDRAGYISDVILDGDMYFCAAETRNRAEPSSGGRGFCSEIQTDRASFEPPEDYYPKFGIGLIPTAGNYPYRNNVRYEFGRLFKVDWEADGNSAFFHTEPAPCSGYEIDERKKISVAGCTVMVEYGLENVGSRALELREFCHNFISIDGMAISPEYVLTFSGIRDLTGEEIIGLRGEVTNLIGKGNGVTFKKPELEVSLANIDMTDMLGEIPFRWRLEHTGVKAFVEGADYIVPDRVSVWASDHIVSPEVIAHFVINPGETAQWKRELTFGRQTGT